MKIRVVHAMYITNYRAAAQYQFENSVISSASISNCAKISHAHHEKIVDMILEYFGQ